MVEEAEDSWDSKPRESMDQQSPVAIGLGAAARQIVHKISLLDEGNDAIYSQMTAAERVRMVWPLTLTAWKFAKPDGFESRLQRHVTCIERR